MIDEVLTEAVISAVVVSDAKGCYNGQEWQESVGLEGEECQGQGGKDAIQSLVYTSHPVVIPM